MSFFDNFKKEIKEEKLKIEYLRKKEKYEKNTNKKFVSYEEYKQLKIKQKELTNKIKNEIKEQTKEILTEEMNPEKVDKSNYFKFILFDTFIIYTDDESLQTNEIFIKNMKWVKKQMENISKESGMQISPFELTLCSTFDELNRFYDYKAPNWVTGFTWGNKVFIKAPNLYKGKLYYNVILHESIHVMIFNNFKVKGYKISVRNEEGITVFFSTPLKEWLKELNHNGANWFYYESAIDVQDDYLTGGWNKVIRKRFKKE